MKLVEIGKFVANFLLLALLLPLWGFSVPEAEYDELSVLFKVKAMRGEEMPALFQDEELYLSVCDVFDFLKIKNDPSPDFGSVEGFFINEKTPYRIDKEKNRINYQGKEVSLQSKDLIQTESGLYLRSDLFGKVFGLNCAFSFRSLSVAMETSVELPRIRELKQELMRNNINRLNGNVKVDTSIGRNYSFFDIGMADWAVRSTQSGQGQNETRFNLAIGSMLAGGETNIALNYTKNETFNSRQQYYNWRLVNNDHQWVRQVMAGKITTNAISSLKAPVIGVQLTNAPTTYRRSFGTYTLSDYTEPGWTVELYVNNVIVDYAKADASGFFTFEVPLVYGNSNVKLRYYGPWGEERSSEQSISIPQNILPKNELEYSIGAGFLEDGKSSRFSRFNMNYGLSSRFTVGGGIEYLSSVSSANSMPFLTMAMRLFSGIFFSGEYTHGVRSMGILRVRRPSNFQMELNYTRYAKGQQAINTSYLEERRVILSMPIRTHNFSAFSRFTFNQFVLPRGKQTRAELLFSGGFKGVSTNLTTYAMFANTAPVNVMSSLSLAFRIPGGFLVRPRVQYNYQQHKLASVRCGLEKHLFKRAYLNLSYEQDFTTRVRSAEIGFRYDLSFARTAFTARRSKNRNTFVQSANGSLMYDSNTHYVGTNNRTSVGKGGITFLPFLDLNGNGHHEENEPKVAGLRLRAKGGRIVRNKRDSVIHLCEMEPYVKYTVVLDPNSLENIAWKLRNSILSITVDPNQFKLVEIPISVEGEVSGMVSQKKNGTLMGQSRIIVNIFNEESKLVARTLTEEDGYFSYLGLSPSNYTARMDSTQLQKLNMTSQEATYPFTIKSDRYGDVVDGLEFTIRTHKSGAIDIPSASEKLLADSPASPGMIHKDDFSIQVASHLSREKAFSVKEKLDNHLQKAVALVLDEGMYKVLITGMEVRKAAEKTLAEIVEDGHQDAYLLPTAEAKHLRTLCEQANLEQDSLLSQRGEYVVQTGVYRIESNALAMKEKVAGAYDQPVVIVFEKDFYKVRLTGFKSYSEAREFLNQIIGDGYWDAFIISVPRHLSF